MPKNEEDFAIVVGINRYPAMRKLHAAEKDAVRFAEWLSAEDGGNLPDRNIRLILSSNYPDPVSDFRAHPVKDDIDAICDELGMGQKSRIGRRLYFYFAGHGLAPNFDDVAMLMANAARHRLSSNIGLHKYRAYLRNAAPFDQVIFLLDCCRDFEDRAEPMGPPFTELQNQDRAPLVKDYLVMAAEFGRRAFEPEEATSGDRRGLLTQALLEGLRDPNRRAVDQQGRVTAASLSAYVKSRVPELAQDARLNQTPEIPAAPEEIIFLRLETEELHKVTVQITAAAGLSGELVLADGNNQELERRPANQTPWELKLEPGLYAISHTDSDQEHLIDARKPKEAPDVYHFV